MVEEPTDRPQATSVVAVAALALALWLFVTLILRLSEQQKRSRLHHRPRVVRVVRTRPAATAPLETTLHLVRMSPLMEEELVEALQQEQPQEQEEELVERQPQGLQLRLVLRVRVVLPVEEQRVEAKMSHRIQTSVEEEAATKDRRKADEVFMAGVVELVDRAAMPEAPEDLRSLVRVAVRVRQQWIMEYPETNLQAQQVG